MAKIFRGKEVNKVYTVLLSFFKTVSISKPKACRNSSMEGFVVCQGFALPPGFQPNLARRFRLPDKADETKAVKFVACGSHKWDSDQSYPLDVTAQEGQRQEAMLQAETRAKNSKFPSPLLLRPAAMAKAMKFQLSRHKSTSNQCNTTHKHASEHDHCLITAEGKKGANPTNIGEVSVSVANINSLPKNHGAGDRKRAYQGPSAPPIDPPYKRALELRRANKLSKSSKR